MLNKYITTCKLFSGSGLNLVHDYLYYLAYIFIRIFSLDKPASYFLQRVKEAIKVHLIVFTLSDYILIDDIIVCFEYAAWSHSLKLWKLLELRAWYGVLTTVASHELEYGLCVRVKIVLIVLMRVIGKYAPERALSFRWATFITLLVVWYQFKRIC